MPSQAFIPLSVLMGSAAIVNTCKYTGALEHKGGQVVWRSWQDFLGVLGIAMLPQVHTQQTLDPTVWLFTGQYDLVVALDLWRPKFQLSKQITTAHK